MASRTRRFFLNALSLTATALIMRGVGVAFNVYVSNRAGAEAMGLYSLLGGVYGLFITLAAAGINLGTTRLVSDALGEDDKSKALRSVKKAILYCSLTSICSACILFFGADILGSILGDARTVPSLRILAVTLPPIALCSCLSGYFTAVRRVKLTSASQILIQGVKILATAALLTLLIPGGAEKICVALCLGGAVAEMVSLAVTVILYLHDRRKNFSRALTKSSEKKKDSKAIIHKLLGITLPVTFSACIRSALTMIQHILIPQGLRQSGSSWESALASYGTLHGMVLPIILFPSAFISSFSGLLIPEVADCRVRENYDRLRRIAYRILTLSLIFSIGVSGIMIFYSNDLGLIIYNSAEASRYIWMLAPLIPIMYIDSAVDAILKGMGHQVYSMNVNIADALTSCILAILLIPHMGLYGYIISIYATEILNTTLSLCKMLTVTKMKPHPLHQVIMPLICVIGATTLSNILLSLFPHLFSAVIELILHIILTVILYMILLLLTKTLGSEEGEVFRASVMTVKSYDKKYRSQQLLQDQSK